MKFLVLQDLSMFLVKMWQGLLLELLFSTIKLRDFYWNWMALPPLFGTKVSASETPLGISENSLDNHIRK